MNVTRTQIGHGGAKQVSSEGKARATIGVDKEWVTAYRGDHVEVNVSTYAKYLEKFLPNPNTRGHVKGLEESGGFLVTAQSTPETARTGKTSGTIAMDQPLGPTVLNYYVVSKTTTANYGRHNAGSSTNVSTTINVLEVAKKYDISIDKKITVDNPNAVSGPEKEKIIAAIKEKNNRTYTDAAYRALLDQATYSVDEKGNVTITYPDKSVDKVASAYTIQKRPVIETSLIDKADTQTPTTVSADPGSKVKLYDHSGHELGEGTANESGRVTINPTRPIPNGNVTAKATDNRDHTTDASAPKQATVPAPQALTIQQPHHGSTSVTIIPQGRTDIITAVIQGKKVKIEKEGSGRYKTLENAANVRISPNSNGSVTFELPSGTRFETLDRIQAIAENKDITVASGIRSSQEANQYVLANKGEKVPVKDINHLTPTDKERVKTAYEKANPGINKSEVTVENNGNITYNHQGRGSVQKGNAKTPDNVVLDNVAPGKPTIPTNLTDKAGTRTQIEVDTEPGASVVLYDHGNQELGRGVANASGKALIDPTKEIPKGNVTAKATDEAGNISHPSDAKVATFQDFTPKVPAKTPVTKVTSLTPSEVNQVKKKVSDANPGKEVQVSTNGTATVTDPKSRISHEISGDKLVESNDKIRPIVEIPYDNPARQEIYVYSGENNDITLKAWDNSGKISKLHLAFAADNRQGLGTEDSYLNGKTRSALYLSATKIHTDTPASQNSPAILKVTGEIPKGEFNEQSGQISRYLFAEDPSGNTNYEHVGHANDVGAPGRIRFVWKPQTFKYDAQPPGTPLLLDSADATQIENAVKQANPTFSDKIKSVTVNGNNVIVTYKDDSTDRLDASKVFKVRDSKPTSPMATAPKDGTVTVTPTGDADKVIVNYTDEQQNSKVVTVVKAKNGTWSSSDKPAGVTVDPRTGTLLVPAEGVKDRSQVTATATKGDSRPSDPKIVTAQPKDFTPVKPDEKVPVKDKAHLTPEEKKQVEDKVKAKNPGKEVTVGEDGTATLKDPTTGISHQIPGTDLVNQDFGVNGIPEVTPSQPAYTDPVGTSSTDGEGNVITPPTVDIPAYTDPVGTSSTDGEGNVITPPSVEVPAYTDPVGTSNTDGDGNVITPPTVDIPAYTDPVGTSSTDGEGNVITPPSVEVPAYTGPVGTSSTDGEGNVITPPTVDIPAYTDPVGTSSTDGEGNVITPPTVEVPAYTDPVGTSSTDGEGNVITPPTVDIPSYTGSVNGIPEVTPAKRDYEGSVNSIPEEMPAQPDKDGSANEMSEGTPISETTINKDRQLPNTGTEKSNTSLIVALLAAMTGGLLISRKRKEEE